jgi:hypothetical protein
MNAGGINMHDIDKQERGDQELNRAAKPLGEFSVNCFESATLWFNDFCRRMARSGLPQMPRKDTEGLLIANLEMQKALVELQVLARDNG